MEFHTVNFLNSHNLRNRFVCLVYRMVSNTTLISFGIYSNSLGETLNWWYRSNSEVNPVALNSINFIEERKLEDEFRSSRTANSSRLRRIGDLFKEDASAVERDQ